MAIKIIRKQAQIKSAVKLRAKIQAAKDPELPKSDYVVEVTDEMYACLLELSRRPGGHHVFDFLYVHPFRNYRKLEDLGLVNVANKNGNYRWKIARITSQGEQFVGVRTINRRRRRRRSRV